MSLKNHFFIAITLIFSAMGTIHTHEELQKPTAAIVREITPENFEREVLQNERPVLVKVGAKWCPPCVQLATILEKIAPDFPSLQFASLDYNDNPKYIKEHSIDGVPTWMVYYKGELVSRQEGCPPSVDALVGFITGIDNAFKQK